jgi:hypothetical protein
MIPDIDILSCPESLRGARVLLEAQIRVLCTRVPREIRQWLREADGSQLLLWARRLAAARWLTSFEDVFCEEYENLARIEFRKRLEARFGPLSREAEVGLGWMEGWQFEEYLPLIESEPSSEAIVFRTGAQQLRLEGYRRARRETAVRLRRLRQEARAANAAKVKPS